MPDSRRPASYSLLPLSKSSVIHALSVQTTSRAVEGIAASAESDYAAHRAAQLLWERTTATIVAKHSNHSESHRVTCVYSFCVCSVVYVILICDRHHTTGQLSPMLFVP